MASRFDTWDRDLRHSGFSTADFSPNGRGFCQDDEGWTQLANVGAMVGWQRQDGRKMEALWTLTNGLVITVRVTAIEICRGLRELEERFECSFIEAKDIVRQRR